MAGINNLPSKPKWLLICRLFARLYSRAQPAPSTVSSSISSLNCIHIIKMPFSDVEELSTDPGAYGEKRCFHQNINYLNVVNRVLFGSWISCHVSEHHWRYIKLCSMAWFGPGSCENYLEPRRYLILTVGVGIVAPERKLMCDQQQNQYYVLLSPGRGMCTTYQCHIHSSTNYLCIFFCPRNRIAYTCDFLCWPFYLASAWKCLRPWDGVRTLCTSECNWTVCKRHMFSRRNRERYPYCNRRNRGVDHMGWGHGIRYGCGRRDT